MARISTYKIDTNVTLDDRVFGSDASNDFETKNYSIGSIIEKVQSEATNILPKIVNVVLDEGETIPSAMQEINLSVSSADRPVLISFFKPTFVSGSVGSVLEYMKITYLFPLGNGEYNPISDFISFEELVLINVNKPSIEDISRLGDLNTISLGDITGQTLSDVVNQQLPSLDLSDSEKTYAFSFEDNGVSFFSLFVGVNGIYGLNDLQSTNSDFTEFTNSEALSFLQEFDVKAKEIQVTVPNDYYDNDTDELNAVTNSINSLSTFDIEQGFYGLVFCQFETPTGVSYTNKYRITRGKGTYGSGGFQLQNQVNNIVKIDDGFRTLDLNRFDNSNSEFITLSEVPQVNIPTDVSAFNNDANYSTESYVDDLVSFRGVYSSKTQINNIASPENGDYAILVSLSGKARQIWKYFSAEWNQMSSVPFVEEFNASNFSLDYIYDNSYVSISGTVNQFTLENFENGTSVFIENKNPFAVGIVTLPGTTSTKQTLEPNEKCIVIYNESDSEYVVKSSPEFLGLGMGTYFYVNSDTSLTRTETSLNQDIIIDGAGIGSFTKDVKNSGEIYSTSTGKIDLSRFSLGDSIKLSVTFVVDNDATQNTIGVSLVSGLGSSQEEAILLDFRLVSANNTTELVLDREIQLNTSEKISFPSVLKLSILEACDFRIKNIYIRVLTNE